MIWPLFRPVIEKFLALSRLNGIYADALTNNSNSLFVERVLSAMDVTFLRSGVSQTRIPAIGPLITIANHPFGGVEGLVLAAVLLQVRSDVRILGNYFLERIPALREFIIPVDPFGGPGSQRRNLAPLRRALRWLESGGALATFPSGEVSHLDLRLRCVCDPSWSETIARLARISKSAVLPVFFEGRNGAAFQLAGLLHSRLRTAMLPRELVKMCHRRIQLRIGQVIPPNRLDRIGDARQATEYLRFRTYALKRLENRTNEPFGLPDSNPPVDPIAAPRPRSELEREVQALSDRRLLFAGPLSVYCTTASEIPTVLHEIGRLRELTFRPVGEGTGRSVDLDRFDSYYDHLFVWHDERHEIIGAYRIGKTDKIIASHGLKGLYTHSLFKFKRALLNQVGPALELGRSFVLSEFQRSFLPLMLLWKGIGCLVRDEPRYRMLFGAVSISDQYDSMTKQLMIAFLKANFGHMELARLVRPQNPPSLTPSGSLARRGMVKVVQSLDEFDQLVREIESSERGLPVLLRQYLKLNGRLLGFNVDPEFGNALDGLILVDLIQTPVAILARYLGADGAKSLFDYHGVHVPHVETAEPARDAG